jgi:hypothetical protein
MRTFLSPFAHELHYSGNRCADDCPACRWVRESQIESLIPAIFTQQKKPQGRVIGDTLMPALSR